MKALLALAVAAGAARADTIAVVVSGDVAKVDSVNARIKGALRKRGHVIGKDALADDEIEALTTCLAIDDQACARNVVDHKAAADALVFASILSTGHKAISITLYWFAKGHPASSVRRACERCTQDGVETMVDDMLGTLAQSNERTGRVVIKSRPEELLVLVDGHAVGQTPIEKDLSPGTHRVVITQDGENLGERQIEVEAGDTTKVVLTAHSSNQTARKVGSVALITGGFGLLVTAGVMISYGTRSGPSEMYVYDNATGIGLIAGGVGLLGIVGGALMWPRAPAGATPIAQIGNGGGVIGLAGRF